MVWSRPDPGIMVQSKARKGRSRGGLSLEQEAAYTLVNAAHKEGGNPKRSTSTYCLLLKAYEDIMTADEKLEQKIGRLNHHRHRLRLELLEVGFPPCRSGLRPGCGS